VQGYEINWPVIGASVALIIVAWVVSAVWDWVEERDDDDDE